MTAVIILSGDIVGSSGIVVAYSGCVGGVNHYIAMGIPKFLLHGRPCSQTIHLFTPHLAFVLKDACEMEHVVSGGDNFAGRVGGSCCVSNQDSFFNLFNKVLEREVGIVGCLCCLIICCKFSRSKARVQINHC